MKNILEKTIEMAIKSGADQADIILSTGSVLSAKAENKKISDYTVNGSQSLGLRVIKNQKIGTSYCESFTDDSLQDLVNQCIQNSKYSNVEPTEEILVTRKKELEGTQEFSYSESRVDPKELINKTLELERKLLAKDKRLKTPPYNNLGEYVAESHYINHLGTYCHEKQKIYSAYTSALIEDGDKKSMFHHSSQSWNFAGLNFEEIINESYDNALALLDGKPIPTGDYDIIFSNDMLSSFFGVFSNLFSGLAAVNELNPFKDKIEKQITSSLISIADQPHRKNGFGYSVYDSEGNIKIDTTLVENGVLKGFLQNSSTSRQLNTKNTFNAHRSSKGTLGTTSSHKVILEGKSQESNLLKENHFEIIHLQGLHSGCNKITGDFSFAASGYLYQSGEKIQAVKGVTVSGNFFNALMNIKLVGNKLHQSSSGRFSAPKIMFSDFRIGGQ